MSTFDPRIRIPENMEASRVPVKKLIGHIEVTGFVGSLDFHCPCGWEQSARPTERSARSHIRRGCPYANPDQLTFGG